MALFMAHTFPKYHDATFTELATNAAVVIGAQTAAYPVVLLFIFFLVRTRSRQRFAEAIQWNWPGASAPGFMLGGVVLALVVEGLARFLPIPKSLPMDTYFHDASQRLHDGRVRPDPGAAAGRGVFPGPVISDAAALAGLDCGVMLTAAAFAAIHGAQLGYAWAPVLSIFVVGLAFTLVRVRTNSVASSFLMHCGYNFALFAALWLASDHSVIWKR